MSFKFAGRWVVFTFLESLTICSLCFQPFIKTTNKWNNNSDHGVAMQCSNRKLWSWQSRGCHSTWITCLNAVEQKNIPYVILDWTASVDLTCPRHPTNARSDWELEFGDQADVSSSLSCPWAISEQFFCMFAGHIHMLGERCHRGVNNVLVQISPLIFTRSKWTVTYIAFQMNTVIMYILCTLYS